MDGYAATELWRVFVERATDEQQVVVRRLLDHAAAMLDRVIETFPTYTLHNHVHAENVVGLMGEVLGPRIDDLTALEAAMLLLSAYWHDIGMVFHPDERAALRDEDAFPRFLNEHPEAFVAVKEHGDDLPLDVAEWYCRWRHADRVYVHLDRLDEATLMWGSISLRDHLGRLCRSHNYGGDVVQELPTALAAQCDLRFCAVVLRLADILDFDRRRSPEAVYWHLELGADGDRTAREQVSDQEWRKHLAADGFQFPVDRPGPYTVEFVAGPDSPSVEHDLRQFLDVIEAEMEECGALASTCSSGWRDVPLPRRVGRSNILARGYKYGEHRFTLDREQVLHLFMGENLYENPFTFVRELLQNSIDASRHRGFYERSRGHGDFEVPPIVVDDWTDRDGYRWVRFDDSGMGMSEQIILDYFLKVGRSYYQSATFQAELLRYAERRTDFQPISRFGIGILSCFVVGDRVEVSTRRVDADGAHPDPIRVSLTGLEGFYTLQLGDMRPAPMPTPTGEARGYRTTPGTTIAVRLDPRKEREPIDIDELLDDYVHVPPVPVSHNGSLVGEHDDVLVDQPLCERQSIPLDDSMVRAAEVELGRVFPDGLSFTALPVDLTATSPDLRVRGQLVALLVEGGDPLRDILADRRAQLRLRLHGEEDVEVWAARYADADAARQELKHLLSTGPDQSAPDGSRPAFGELERLTSRSFAGLGATFQVLMPGIAETLRSLRLAERDLGGSTVVSWSHNGIAFPSPTSNVTYSDQTTSEGVEFLLVGSVAVADGLGPEVTVSRDRLLSLPHSLLSVINLALHRALSASGYSELARTAFLTGNVETLTMGSILADCWFGDPSGWPQERIIPTPGGFRSIVDVCEVLGPGSELYLPLYGETRRGFIDFYAAALLQVGAQVEVRRDDDGTWLHVLRSVEPSSIGDPLKGFPPLFFVPYEGSNLLKAHLQPVNSRHPVAAWLQVASTSLNRQLPTAFRALRGLLYTSYPGQRWRKEVAERINATLDRIREVAPELAPPKGLRVTEEDFGG